MSGDPGGDGVGAVSTLISTPLAQRTATTSLRGYTFFLRSVTTIGNETGFASFADGTDQQFTINYTKSGVLQSVTHGNFTNGDRFIEGIVKYKVKTS